MASPTWKISGDYFEACSCDSVCPCPTSGLAARPTQGYCDAGLVFHVERGSYGSDHARRSELRRAAPHPGADDRRELDGRADRGRQGDARAARGADRDWQRTGRRSHGRRRPARRHVRRSARRSRSGSSGTACAGRRRSRACSTSPSKAFRARVRPSRSTSTTSAHPAATRLALAKASRGHMHAFGINWDDTTGKNNGHFAPFSWSSS